MKKTKKILSILLSCLMLMSMLSVGVFAADGTQKNPINANDKWFGYGVDCFLMNTTLAANDTDGVWYKLTADAAGILHVEHSSTELDYQIVVNVNGQEYLGYENGVYNKPVMTLPVAVGDVITIQIIAQDTAQGGLIYCNAKFVTGENNINEMIKLKGGNVKIWIANGATVYLQDDSLQAEYAAMGLKLESGVNGEGITVISSSKNYTDTDGDGYIELKLGGSAGSAGVPAVKPSFAITNESGQDSWFLLNVVENTIHECVYDDNTDTICNTCGAERDERCFHTDIETYYESGSAENSHNVVHKCLLCEKIIKTQEEPCYGGTATCITPATCDGCKMPYGEATGIHTYGDDDSMICIHCGVATPTIVVSTVKEADAGDEIEVTVLLKNNPGVILAKVNVLYDESVMELCSYYDEDEEDYFNMIEVGAGFNATSNKYITFGPLGTCLVTFARSNAKTPVTNELFFTATFKIKEDAYSGTYPLSLQINPADFFTLNSVKVPFDTKDTTITINGTEPPCPHEYAYACDKVCLLCGEETNPDATHTIVAVEAKTPSCTESGNLAHWYCSDCGSAWLDAACTLSTNLKAVVLPASCSYGAVHTAAKTATCTESGNLEYWYCANCNAYYTDAACTAKATLDEVILPIIDHTYDEDMDVDCNVCGHIRVVEYTVLTGNGFSVSKDVNGLAFRFDVSNIQLKLYDGAKYNVDYENCSITPNSTGTYKLVAMGAVVSNNGSTTRLENVDNLRTKNVPAEKVQKINEGTPYYAIRVIEIPDEKKDDYITVSPYFIYENAEGELITVYGDEMMASYNSAQY